MTDLFQKIQEKLRFLEIPVLISIQKIKSYVSVSPIGTKASFSKRSSYKIERWLSSSENQEGLSENWLDLFFNPMNVNNMNYDDLYSLPNLSPISLLAWVIWLLARLSVV